MHELNAQELFLALQYAKSLDEETGKKMMIEFEIDQPLLFQTVFNTFASIIATRHQDMSHLFMDLCFDVLCVYRHTFGAMPKFSQDPTWMESQVMLIDKELKPLMKDGKINEKNDERMKQLFFSPREGETMQYGLLEFMHQAINQFVEENVCDNATAELTNAMLFVVVRLFNNLYTQPTLH